MRRGTYKRIFVDLKIEDYEKYKAICGDKNIHWCASERIREYIRWRHRLGVEKSRVQFMNEFAKTLSLEVLEPMSRREICKMGGNAAWRKKRELLLAKRRKNAQSSVVSSVAVPDLQQTP